LPKNSIKEVIASNLVATVYTYDMAEAINAEAERKQRTIHIQLKIDTGMNRLGIKPEEALPLIKKIRLLKNIRLEGIFSHFSVADETDKTYTEWQFRRLQQLLDLLRKEKIDYGKVHTANSAALVDIPKTYLDYVRAGIIIYGLYPSEEVNKENLKVDPILSFKTEVAHVKIVEPGESISYVRTYTTKKRTKIITLPVGYADGYNRLLSNKGEVLINGLRHPIVGNVCMDMCMAAADMDEEIKQGDEAVLIGSQGNERIPIEELAKKTGTINYEVQCAIQKRVPRVYFKNRKLIDVVKYT
ncbi:MAG: alanine racemase, partial [Nanoarchaeota archaeon]|nr:alanine racemase [Nanoarchaeota archaeon]